MRILNAALTCGVLISACVPTAAQWTTPTPGLPRMPNGKANLSAPAPKTSDGKPDFSGLWQGANGKYLENLAADTTGQAPTLPWAEAYFKKIQTGNGAGRPQEKCLPHGITDYDALPMPIKIVQTPGNIVILYEAYNHFRQVFMDGRALPKDPQPTWMGYSVGKFEGDTLVVDSNGFNDQTWLDDGGHPHTEALRVTERLRRRDFGHIDLQLIVEDPKAYTKPWGATLRLNLLPDDELIENICENEKDFEHIVGR
jgi:hypothetical protein